MKRSCQRQMHGFDLPAVRGMCQRRIEHRRPDLGRNAIGVVAPSGEAVNEALQSQDLELARVS